ncbi:hypothetical protein DITRI_Ditri13aG0155500 [Diplodiscus trichospermus]
MESVSPHCEYVYEEVLPCRFDRNDVHDYYGNVVEHESCSDSDGVISGVPESNFCLVYDSSEAGCSQTMVGKVCTDYRGLAPRFFIMSAWGTPMILAYEYLRMDPFLFLTFCTSLTLEERCDVQRRKTLIYGLR